MRLWAVDGCFSLSCFSEQKRLNSLPRRSLQGSIGSWGGWQDGILSPCLGGMAGTWEETEDILDWAIVMEIRAASEPAIDFIRVWFEPGIRFLMI